ncbi:MAG TPA: hypothetical protein VEU11_12620, partial [Terriglobales bacterium]|nr:hypothetical protein [Terriglobales bacterium]
MKRDITRLMVLAAIKKVAFAALCMSLPMLVAAPALADQCSAPTIGVGTGTVGSAPNSDSGDTCGVLITVTQVDPHTGAATAFTVTNEGNGNPYDQTLGNPGEDTLVGVLNSSGGDLTSIPLTSSSNPGVFAFDSDGPCQITLNSYSWCDEDAT